MPLSKNRRKNGKKILRGKARQEERARELARLSNPISALTLQDLINVVAVQESQKNGPTVVAEDATINFADNLPVTITNEDGTKRVVGTAAKIPGDENGLSINITDPDILEQVQGPVDHFSIEEETQDGR
jgi:hypothetical protein